MGTEWAYTPCQCLKCRHRAVYGVCRCRYCKGDRPEDIRAAQHAKRKAEATRVAGQLLAKEDQGPLSDEEALELEEALAYLTRRI